MCQAKEKIGSPTLRTMDVWVDNKIITVNFNCFEVNKKRIFRVGIAPDGKEKILFSKIRALEQTDQTYLDYVEKEYDLIATGKIKAQKKVEKKLSKRRA